MNKREQVAQSTAEDGGDVPPKRRLTKYLHGATSQKTAFFIIIAVKTSNLIK
jgi:hypothetical protein